MNRSDGLVQRRNIQATTVVESRDDDDIDDKKKSQYEEDDQDHDSKETRLTLMEEVLLLGLKDREVCIPGLTFIPGYKVYNLVANALEMFY